MRKASERIPGRGEVEVHLPITWTQLAGQPTCLNTDITLGHILLFLFLSHHYKQTTDNCLHSNGHLRPHGTLHDKKQTVWKITKSKPLIIAHIHIMSVCVCVCVCVCACMCFSVYGSLCFMAIYVQF